MLPQLAAFCLRRVLLAGSPCPMRSAMNAQLHAIGAQTYFAPDPLTEEPLCRTLHKGRFACVIVPELLHLGTGNAQTCLAALDTLLNESREAGVPLVMLLAGQSLHANEIAALFSQALGWSRGISGDPVSVQCIRYDNQQPDAACCEALLLGARFLSGETSCTGYFSLQI